MPFVERSIKSLPPTQFPSPRPPVFLLFPFLCCPSLPFLFSLSIFAYSFAPSFLLYSSHTLSPPFFPCSPFRLLCTHTVSPLPNCLSILCLLTTPFHPHYHSAFPTFSIHRHPPWLPLLPFLTPPSLRLTHFFPLFLLPFIKRPLPHKPTLMTRLPPPPSSSHILIHLSFPLSLSCLRHPPLNYTTF